jgi:hypothetical protein
LDLLAFAPSNGRRYYVTRALGYVWAVLIWLFIIMIPIQFYLAGHGAMEGAHAGDNSIVGMKSAWDPHIAFGTLMVLVSLLTLLVALAARLPRRLLGHAAALFVFMVIQFLLPNWYDSASTRWIAALHGVNALIVTWLAYMLARGTPPYLPIARFRRSAVEATTAESEVAVG